MGYYTYFDITVRCGTHSVYEVERAIIGERNGIFGGFDLCGSQECSDTIWFSSMEGLKWYDEESDMKEFSKRFPGATFVVEGTGEEQGDIWVHEYKNGKERERHVEFVWTDWSDVE